LQEITNQSWDVKKMQQHLSEALNDAIHDWLMKGNEKCIELFETYCIEIK
jgi:hypothetical protein